MQLRSSNSPRIAVSYCILETFAKYAAILENCKICNKKKKFENEVKNKYQHNTVVIHIDIKLREINVSAK